MDKQKAKKAAKSKAIEFEMALGDKFEVITLEVFNYLIDQLDESGKPAVPSYVADWIEKCKDFNLDLFESMTSSQMSKEVSDWLEGLDGEGLDLYGRAWLDGYTVEEKRKYKLTLERETIELDVIENERPTETENRVKEQLENAVYWEEVQP